MKRKIPPLIIEKIIDETNLYFLSVIEFRRMEYLGVINDITATHIKAYTFENIRPNSIQSQDFLSLIIQWYYADSFRKPLSISLSQNGMTGLTAPLYKSFELNGVSRIIGNPFIFSQFTECSTKKRKVLPIPEGIEIRLRKTVPTLGSLTSLA
jgi:hypothetical protein